MIEKFQFLAFTLAFADADSVAPIVGHQLRAWWGEAIEQAPNGDQPVFERVLEINPRRKSVSIYRLAGATLIQSNLADGYSSLSRTISKSMPTAAFATVRTGWQRNPKYKIDEFCHFQHSPEHFRIIRAMVETNGWDFFEKGPVQSFEEPDLYQTRLKRDRINRGVITRYLGRLGVDLEQIAGGCSLAPVAQFHQFVND